jgi:agmatine/peptidylarginine deiminase
VYLVLLIILISVTLFGRGLGMRRARGSLDGGGRPVGVVPGEFERQEAVLLSWPLLLRSTDNSGPAEKAPLDRVLCDIVGALRQDVRVIVLADKEFARNRITTLLAESDIPEDSVEFLSVPANYEWIRDYGPLCLRLPNGSLALVDADYCTDHLVNAHPQEDRVPRVMGEQLGAKVVHAPITIQHGNLLSNGRGLCLTTQLPVLQNRTQGYSENDVARILGTCYGAERVLFLEAMVGELTGHVDMFATFTGPDTVVVGRYAKEADPVNAAILDRNAARLAALKPPYGPLQVVRIPMPRRVRLTSGQELWPTYTNVVYGNGKLLVPTYAGLDPDAEAVAMSVYQRLLPDREIVGIDAGPLLSGGGSLHCVTMNLPSP